MSSSRRRLWSWLKAVYVLAVIVSIVVALNRLDVPATQLQQLAKMPQGYAFVVAWIVMVFILGWLWALWLKWNSSISLPVRCWLPIQAMAWSGRYLPGKLGLLAGKAALLEERKIGLGALSQSVLVEQFAFVLAGAGVGLVVLPPEVLAEVEWIPFWILRAWPWLAILGCLTCVAAHLAVVQVANHALDRNNATRERLPRAAVLFLLYLAPHILIGAAFYALLVALFPGSSPSLGSAVSVLALAHVAGVAAIFAPAGLGVRELALAAGIGHVIGFGEALLVAALLRVLTTVADGLIACGSVVFALVVDRTSGR